MKFAKSIFSRLSKGIKTRAGKAVSSSANTVSWAKGDPRAGVNQPLQPPNNQTRVNPETNERAFTRTANIPAQSNSAPLGAPNVATPPEFINKLVKNAPPGHSREPRSRDGVLMVHGIEKSYKGRKVVDGVSLGVRRGEAVGLLGPNGAGKTTCFYMITGLVPVDAGTIFLNGYDITSTPMYRRSRLGIGYLPQEASIFRGLSVENNIRAVLEVVEPSKKEREKQLDALLEEFSISKLRKSPSIALSGGERRRCEIARALASRPSFMLLDEPFAGIDPIAVGDIQELVRHLTRRGIGVLITDHNVRETLGLIDRAYILHNGGVLTHGRAEEIVRNEDVKRLYLGEQFTF